MAVRTLIQVPHLDDRRELEGALTPVFSNEDGNWFVSVVEPAESASWHVRVEGPNGYVWSHRFDGPADQEPAYIAATVARALTVQPPLNIRRVHIEGFGPFEKTIIDLRPLTVLVGTNGSGKTSLFELLRAIREYTRTEIPPEVVPGWETREMYHRPGPNRLSCRLGIEGPDYNYAFDTEIIGAIGNPILVEERVVVHRRSNTAIAAKVIRRGDTGSLEDDGRVEFRNVRPNQLAFRAYVSPAHERLYPLREHIDSWRFFSGIRFNETVVRQPARVEDNPILREDGGNLASVLNWLQVEKREIFNEIETHLRGIIPAFRSLAVKPSGAGRVTIQWTEEGFLSPLTAADLSDGSLRLLLWLTLALSPNRPGLVCIDEPETGLHPRTLPFIAALLTKLSAHTQVIVATHSSYLLAHFDLDDVVIFRKRNNTIEALRPADSKALMANLDEFGSDEIELMHRSNELEALT